MAFILPAFNLTCNLYTGPWLTKVLRASPPCNLAWGRRVNPNQILGSTFPGFDFQQAMSLLLPAGTDVRDASQSDPIVYDIVEVPAASGRFYGVFVVDDIGKGFSNEHRCAVILKIYQSMDPVVFAGLIWPTPMP
jgi:hypothetical protein